jgi:50S ribosomal subunit-associated GTPase HflX
MKVYITKYALTKGIIEVNDVELCAIDSMIKVPSIKTPAYFHGDEWYETEEDAIADVLSRIARKRKSIDKQIQKLDKLEDELKEKVIMCSKEQGYYQSSLTGREHELFRSLMDESLEKGGESVVVRNPDDIEIVKILHEQHWINIEKEYDDGTLLVGLT